MNEAGKQRILARIRQILKKKRPMPNGWDIEDVDRDGHMIVFETDDESILFAVGVNAHTTCIEWKFAKLVLFPKKGDVV